MQALQKEQIKVELLLSLSEPVKRHTAHFQMIFYVLYKVTSTASKCKDVQQTISAYIKCQDVQHTISAEGGGGGGGKDAQRSGGEDGCSRTRGVPMKGLRDRGLPLKRPLT